MGANGARRTMRMDDTESAAARARRAELGCVKENARRRLGQLP